MDFLDYTPQQAIQDAAATAASKDFDGALIILFSESDDGDIELSHFLAGAGSQQIIGILDLVKTKFALRTLGLDA